MTLLKEAPLRWRLIPRGAAYHHLLSQLEALGRGDACSSSGAINASSGSSDSINPSSGSSDAINPSRAGGEYGPEVLKYGPERLPLPRILSRLWPHQQRSVATTLAGVRQGKLGFADASAVGFT